MQKQNGFTLAEILITLTIIGIVAAITIPTIINRFQEQSYLSQFKKVYTNLSQAYLQSAQENGTADAWADAKEVYKNLKPYLKYIKDCPTACNGWGIETLGISGFTRVNNYNLILADGSTIQFADYAGTVNHHLAYVDINGEKGPNKFGYDFFIFEFAKINNAPIVTYGYYEMALIKNNPSYCTKYSAAGTGWYGGGSCTYWVLKNWNMDYLQRDIPTAEWIK